MRDLSLKKYITIIISFNYSMVDVTEASDMFKNCLF